MNENTMHIVALISKFLPKAIDKYCKLASKQCIVKNNFLKNYKLVSLLVIEYLEKKI